MKRVISFIISVLLRFFHLFAIKRNRIFFESYGGTQYSCSPKYIFLELIKTMPSADVVWFLKTNKNDIPKAKIINKKRIKYFYYLLTSKVVITNVNFSSYVPFRKKQCLINTWHGAGPYKYAFFGKEKRMVEKSFKKFNYLISSSLYFSKYVIQDTFGFRGKIIESGLPRNDPLFSSKSIFRNKISKYIRLELNDCFVCLYAPTYRDKGMDDLNLNSLNYAKLIESLEKRFNKKCLLFYRGHHFTNNNFDSNLLINLTDYPDMQELIGACDFLISDYSSSIWDMSLTGKPCMLFTPDLKEFQDSRSFYLDIHSWGFPVAEDTDTLCKMIESFDAETYLKTIKEMHNKWGSFETGSASNVLVDIIKKELTNG